MRFPGKEVVDAEARRVGLLTPDRGRVALLSDFALDLRQPGGNGSLAAGMLGAGL